MIFLGSQDLSWQHTYTEQENGRAVQTHVYACGCVHTFAHGVVHALYSTSLYFMCVSMCVNISAKLDASEDENTHHCIDGNENLCIIIGIKNLCMYVCNVCMYVHVCMCENPTIIHVLCMHVYIHVCVHTCVIMFA